MPKNWRTLTKQRLMIEYRELLYRVNQRKFRWNLYQNWAWVNGSSKVRSIKVGEIHLSTSLSVQGEFDRPIPICLFQGTDN